MRFGAGLVSGLITGTAAIGGIALAVLLSTSRMAPAMLVGIGVGQRSFAGTSPRRFREHVLTLLTLLALLVVVRAALGG